MAYKWKEELEKIQPKYEKALGEYKEAVRNLASCEIIEHNKKDLERVIRNEGHEKKNRSILVR